MQRINEYHEEILAQARAHGINLDTLRKKWGLIFVIKLIKYLQKQTSKNQKDFIVIFPKKNFDYNKDSDTYLEDLRTARIPLKMWDEDFVDEDSGEVITIQRFEFLPLKSLAVSA